jgi:hypothetical protein
VVKGKWGKERGKTKISWLSDGFGEVDYAIGRPRGLSGVGFSVPESYLAPSETSGGEPGHENASTCPIGNGSPVTSAAQMVRIPRAKQLIRHTGAGEPLTPGWCGYFRGLISDLANEYHYIVGRSLVNAGFRQNVPAWVYTHTYNPYMERGGK